MGAAGVSSLTSPPAGDSLCRARRRSNGAIGLSADADLSAGRIAHRAKRHHRQRRLAGREIAAVLGNNVKAAARPVMIPNAAAASPARTFCRSWREGWNSYAGGFDLWWNNIAASSAATPSSGTTFRPFGPIRDKPEFVGFTQWSGHSTPMRRRRAAICRALQIGLGQLLASALRRGQTTATSLARLALNENYPLVQSIWTQGIVPNGSQLARAYPSRLVGRSLRLRASRGFNTSMSQ